MMIGGALICLGFLLASYSTEVWHLYFTQGLICGIGYSLVYNAGMSVVGQWFSKRRGLALGISVSGSGFGQFIMVNITSALLTSMGWRATLQYLALIELCGLIVCVLLVKRLTPCIAEGGPSLLSSARELFKDRHFFYLYMGYVVVVFGYVMPFVHLPTYAVLHGLSTSQANLLLSLIGVASAIGRISIGKYLEIILCK